MCSVGFSAELSLVIWNIKQHVLETAAGLSWLSVLYTMVMSPPFSDYISQLAGSSCATGELLSSLGVSFFTLLVSLSLPLLWMSERVRACPVNWMELLWPGDQWRESERGNTFRAGHCSLEKGNFALWGSRPFCWCIVTMWAMEVKCSSFSPYPHRTGQTWLKLEHIDMAELDVVVIVVLNIWVLWIVCSPV